MKDLMNNGFGSLFANLKKKTQPKEVEFACKKCGSVWYATQKDLNESRRLKRDIWCAKSLNAGFHTVKTHTENRAKISQMQMAYKDYYRCPECGSRDVESKC